MGKSIAQDYHYGIRIDNIVYENLTMADLEFGKWLADLEASGSFDNITSKVVNKILNCKV